MMSAVRSQPDLFGVDKEGLRPFGKFVLMLEGQLLDGMLLQVRSRLVQTSVDRSISELY